MHSRSICLETQRLRLRCWTEADRGVFAALHSHPEVMNDLGGPINPIESKRKLDRYIEAFDQYGFSRWAIETLEGEFIGYAGVMPRRDKHPLGSHNEIGWRLTRKAWGHGYATEAARAALDEIFERTRLTEIVAYTSPDNTRSRAVMERLNLLRDPLRDFVIHDNKIGVWQGRVWVASTDKNTV